MLKKIYFNMEWQKCWKNGVCNVDFKSYLLLQMDTQNDTGPRNLLLGPISKNIIEDILNKVTLKIFFEVWFFTIFWVKFPLQILCKILVRISLKMWKIAKIVNFQTQITFYLRMRRQKRKYEFVSEFYELFENYHHLSDLLN